jgi:chromosome segregation ATPase
MKLDVEQKQEETAKELSAQAGQLNQRKVDLDAREEELAEREQKLAETLRQKDEEVARLVTEQTQGQEQEFKEKIAALAKDYAGKLKEATDAAAAAEVTRKEMEEKAAKLEADLKANGERLSTLESERAKVTHTLAEMQTTIANKTELLAAANSSIEDLTLKLSTLTGTLEGAKKREEILAKELQKEKDLLQSAATAQNKFRDNVELFTDRLADAAADIDKELTTLELQGFGYPTDENMQTSAKLALFFDGVAKALKQLQENHRTKLANESRKLCQGVLRRLLVKIAYRNPGVDFTNIFKKLPKGYDTTPLEALVAPIVDRVGQVQRVEGEYRD